MSQTTGPLVGGALGSIAAVALPLTAFVGAINGGIYIQALSGNTAPIYVGGAGVTTANGFAVAAGATSPLIPVSDPSTVYVISTGGSQSLRWIGG